VTGLTFGTGVRWESFHRSGNTPDDAEQLKIAVTGFASSGANSLRRRAGIIYLCEAVQGIILLL